MSSYQYRNPHVKDKMASQPSYLKMGISIPGKDGLYIEMAADALATCVTRISAAMVLIVLHKLVLDFNE